MKECLGRIRGGEDVDFRRKGAAGNPYMAEFLFGEMMRAPGLGAGGVGHGGAVVPSR